MGRRRVTLLWSEGCGTQLRCDELGQSKGDPHIDREKLVMFNNQMQLEHILQCLPPVTEWNSSSADVNSKPPIDFRHLEVHLPNIQFAVVCTRVGWCPSGTTHSCKDISTMLHFATVTLTFLMCFITVRDSQNILINVSLVKIKKNTDYFAFTLKIALIFTNIQKTQSILNVIFFFAHRVLIPAPSPLWPRWNSTGHRRRLFPGTAVFLQLFAEK